MILYKYQTIDSYFWKNLKTSSLWFQNPRNFDDDFDSNLALNTDFSNIELEALIRASYELNFKTQDRFENFIGDSLDKLKQSSEFKKHFFYGLIEEHTNKRMGITCFSINEYNPILWGNYTNKGSGVCISFDTNSDKVFFRDLYPILYIESLPQIRFDFTKMDDGLRNFYTLKNKIWENQKEYRLFRHKQGLAQYNPNSIKEIIFGSRTDIKDIKKTISIVLQINSKINFFQIKAIEGKYIKEKI